MPENKYYTCDRCSKAYRLQPSDVWGKQCCFKCSPSGAMVETVYKYGFVDEYVKDALDDVESAIVTAGFGHHVDRYDLCPDCVRELEKFLSNK